MTEQRGSGMTSHSKDAPGGNAQIILVTGATDNQGGAAAARLLTGWRALRCGLGIAGARQEPAHPANRLPAGCRPGAVTTVPFGIKIF